LHQIFLVTPQPLISGVLCSIKKLTVIDPVNPDNVEGIISLTGIAGQKPQVVTHQLEADFLRQGDTPLPQGSNILTRKLIALHDKHKFPDFGYEPCKVDIEVSNDFDLAAYGEGDVQELRVVLRADVQGTLEAFAKAAADLSTKEIKVKILHEGTGTITESDILLASASDAIIIGFNVRASVKVKEHAVKENVDVRSYDVIYHALDDIRKAMVGMLEPTFEEEVAGLAEVRETFSVPKIGTIAGCFVLNGKILRTAKVRVLREGVVIYTGKIESLRRFKDDVKEVASGYECGIGVEKFNDLKVGDNLEAFIMNEVEATL